VIQLRDARKSELPSLSELLDPHVIDGLTLMRAFVKIADAADRRKVIELAAALARSASPPIAPT
jgi:N-acetylglutamate synthase-like GNAT family acetyltransferase